MTTRRARRLRALAVVGVLVAAAGCRPEIDFDPDGRTSQVDRVVVTATVQPDGVVHVEQRYTFATDEGGSVGLPDLSEVSFLPGARNVTVDGEPAVVISGTFKSELAIETRRATVGYDLAGSVQRYQDIGVVELDVFPIPDQTSRQDPNVDLSGTLVLPGATGDAVEAHLHGGRDRRVTIDGLTVRFSMEAPAWHPSHTLAVAFPSGLMPFVSLTPITDLPTFQTAQRIQDDADTTTEKILDDLDSQEDLGRWVLTAVAFGLPAIFWALVVKALLLRLRDRRRVVRDVPDELSDPPTGADPALVAVLEGEGRPERTAVAGTILAMAARKAVDLQAFGDRLVVKIPLATTGENRSEQIVLEALRRHATPDGVIDGPVWPSPPRWWRGFRRDAVKRAHEAGLATRWMPLLPLSGALTTTGVGAGIFFFTNTTLYVAIVMGVQVLAWGVSFASGWTLTDAGWRQRALWQSFARYIRQQGRIKKDVGPEGVVVWGPYLVYGAVLGEARGAARPLTP